MFQSLEARRLFAATATLKDGVLAVVGTNESERIQVNAGFKVANAVESKSTTISTAAVTAQYVVTVDGAGIGTFAAADVKRINIFANGGNDRITAPTQAAALNFTATGTDDTTTDTVVRFKNSKTDAAGNKTFIAYVNGGTAQRVTLPAIAAVPLYVEGGSGRDAIYGGDGNDTLKGGRGNDLIVDYAGRNYLAGESGDDTILALKVDVRQTGGTGGYTVVSPTTVTGRARILGGAGHDTVVAGTDDILLDTPESRALPISILAGSSIRTITNNTGLALSGTAAGSTLTGTTLTGTTLTGTTSA